MAQVSARTAPETIKVKAVTLHNSPGCREAATGHPSGARMGMSPLRVRAAAGLSCLWAAVLGVASGLRHTSVLLPPVGHPHNWATPPATATASLASAGVTATARRAAANREARVCHGCVRHANAVFLHACRRKLGCD